MKRLIRFASVFSTVSLFAFSAAGQPESALTVAEAEAFIRNAEQRLLALSVEAGRADWVKINFITEDTEILAAKADERAINAGVELAKQSVRFDTLALPPELARKMTLLKNGLTLATPADPKESEQLTRIASSMEGLYGKSIIVDVLRRKQGSAAKSLLTGFQKA